MSIKKEKEKYSANQLFETINSIQGLEEKEYEFEWKLETGLRFVSDKMFDIIIEILKNGNLILEEVIEEKEEKKIEKIKINCKIESLCDFSLTTDELYKKIKDNEFLSKTKRNNFICTKRNHMDFLCTGCNLERCPKFYAGYVLYLKNTGKLEQVLNEREEYRNNVFENDYFTFEWKDKIGLRKIPESAYNLANEIVNRGLIRVNCNLDKELVKFYTPFGCKDIYIISTNLEKIEEYRNIDLSKCGYYTRSPNEILDFCKNFDCRLDGCIVTYAAYIYYLKKSNKENIILEERKYYAEHREELDNEFEKRKLEKTTSLKKQIFENKNAKEIIKLEKIDNVNYLLNKLFNANQRNLHITLEGNDIDSKLKYETSIFNILVENNKIKEKQIQRMSLQNLASKIVHFSNNTKIEDRDKNGTPYWEIDKSSYLSLPENALIILDRIDEFVDDYKKYKNQKGSTGTYIEGRNKQFTNTLDVLTDMISNNYIIINSTTKEVDRLFNLDSRLQFAFQNSRFIIKDLSTDKMFEEFLKGLNPNLLEIIRKDDNEIKCKKQFIEYISLNKSFLPITEMELVNYILSFVNDNDEEIIFPENIYKKETVEESFSKIIGLENVKDKVKEFEKYMIFQMKSQSLGMKLTKTNMHMIFTGNPGTGKTTIARIMAKMLFDLGIIKENKLVEVERKDLIAQYTGQTAPKTAEVIEKAMGGVLFIDEAYTLASKGGNDFGSEAIATLIKAMEDRKGEFVVIFAGYRDEMKSFIDINPGIASRIGYTFHFDDYSPSELTQMFRRNLESMGFEVEHEIDDEIMRTCEYFSKKKAFGNGRFIDKYIQDTLVKHALNGRENLQIITMEDIPSIEGLNNTKISKDNAEKMLDNLIGMEQLKGKIKEFEKYVKFIKEAQNHKIIIPNQNMHMIFTGNPGTGKTTVARIIAELLFNLGMIHENKLVEVERKDLIAEYIGQTAPKTAEVIEKAMGGVLFIDEAYTLASKGENDYGSEAIATLIKAMEDKKGEFVVIFAGYRDEMKSFMNINPGIASRVGYTFDFEDYTDIELAEIYYKKINKTGMKIEKKAKVEVLKIMKYFCNVENIGNGRFVDRVFQETLLKHSKNENKIIEIIDVEDIPTIQDITKNLFGGNEMIDPGKINKEDQRKTAIHEVGHATLRYILYKSPNIKKITISAEGTGTLGYVQFNQQNVKYTQTKTEKLNEIKVLLAGMASEKVFNGEFESGNSSDLRKATNIAERMVTVFGMSDLGLGQINKPEGDVQLKVYQEINKILDNCFKETIEIIEKNKSKMKKVVDYIIKNKEIDEEKFIETFNNNIRGI